MTVVDASAIAMIRELRDRLERRLSESEDGRALRALNSQLDLLERQRWAVRPLALPAPEPQDGRGATASAHPAGPEPAPEEEFDLDKWVAPPPRPWWRRFG